MAQLDKLTIKGYKSIKLLENFELNSLNILIGANGAGKSNFISIFKFLNNIVEQNLQLYTQLQGGPDAILHYGRKTTDTIQAEFYFGNNGYTFDLTPTTDNRFIFANEAMYFDGKISNQRPYIGRGYEESHLKDKSTAIAEYVRASVISGWKVYHFHDVGDTAKMKQIHNANQNISLATDGANLAAFLLMLSKKHQDHYQQIIKTIQMVAPFFGGFILRDEDNIELEWFEKSNKNMPFKASLLSDGTLRFICLAVALLQPDELNADTILIDEPELGLHPYAITILAELFKRSSETKQLVVASQSVELINHFEPKDIIVSNKKGNASTFERLDNKKLQGWLEEYSLGELWKQNIIGGRPSS